MNLTATHKSARYGTITIKGWHPQRDGHPRAYVNATMLSKSAGYIDLTTGAVVSTSGNHTIISRILEELGVTGEELAARFRRGEFVREDSCATGDSDTWSYTSHDGRFIIG